MQKHGNDHRPIEDSAKGNMDAAMITQQWQTHNEYVA
jgi:hypothetical protein